MDSLAKLYVQRLNLQNAIFSRIDHEDALVAIVYRVVQPGSPEQILKICTRPHDYLCEVYFLRRFAGILPVARIVQLVQPENGIDGAILMECLPGNLLEWKDFNGQLAYEIGSLLAHIHLSRVSGYGDLVQAESLSPDPRYHFTLKFEEGLAECESHLPAVLFKQCCRYFDTHIDLIASVDGPCIIHRDFRPGNLIVYEDKLQGIIDWASARAGFAEEDFCSLEHRQGQAAPSSKRSFLAGYASIRPLPDYKALMPLLRLSKAVASVGFTVKRRTWESSGAHLYQFNRQFLETFFHKED